MIILEKISQMQHFSNNLRKEGKKIGLVPTMGYLHEGHISLIKRARELCDFVITTIFVNPTQFAPNEDFGSYPRNFERDVELAKNAGCDLIFAPHTEEMYSTGFHTKTCISNISEPFEGEFRPTHFDGVALIVAKLFNSTLPDLAVFGQKDYQQTLVIKTLVSDLNFPIDIIIAPTIREKNGLARSSRNKYLSPMEFENASIIYKALAEGKEVIEKGEADRKIINAYMLKKLRELSGIKVQYCASANADNLSQPAIFLAGERIVLLIACHLGKTRLIDNIVLTIPFQLRIEN